MENKEHKTAFIIPVEDECDRLATSSVGTFKCVNLLVVLGLASLRDSAEVRLEDKRLGCWKSEDVYVFFFVFFYFSTIHRCISS